VFAPGIYVVTNPARYCSQAQRCFLLEVFDARIVCRIGGQLSAEVRLKYGFCLRVGIVSSVPSFEDINFCVRYNVCAQYIRFA
jgi:hypothetical protein